VVRGPQARALTFLRRVFLPFVTDRTLPVCMACGALAGIAIALQVLDPKFIAGTGGKWIRPENDYIAYLVAWNYYIVDQWRFPLFDVPAMGYPEGGSVLFNDALPLAAIATKILYQATGARVNPFGWWIFLTYVLQGAMAARAVYAVGVRSIWACTAAAVLAIVNASFLSRMGHTALSSHFLVLWVVALHFESVRGRRVRALESASLLAISLLINAYLLAMVFVLELATLLTLGLRGWLRRRDLAAIAAGTALVALLGLVAGYGTFLVDPTTMKSQGFGLYSWNLAGLLLPPDGVLGFFAGVPRSGTHGQYEGEAYIGRGALLLLALCLISSPKKVLEGARRHWIYLATLSAFAIYAASNVVYAGNVLLIQYDLPQFAVDLGNYFRATGRFIWPLAYSLALLPIACIFKWWRPMPAIAAAALAVFLQLNEALPQMRYRRVVTTQAYEDLIDAQRMDGWLTQHDRLWQYPSWACGGLLGPTRRWATRESNRELQVQLAAARAGVPTNSVYTSRVLKNCPTELRWGATPRLEPGVLYLLGPHIVATSPALIELAQSDACITLDWAVVCSVKWSRVAERTKRAESRQRGNGAQHEVAEARRSVRR
jgi:Family of unknown function (DUF6311)